MFENKTKTEIEAFYIYCSACLFIARVFVYVFILCIFHALSTFRVEFNQNDCYYTPYGRLRRRYAIRP